LFFNEAQVTATLSHPGIVTLYDAVEDGDDRYLVMEFVDGVTLRQYLADGPLMPATAVALVIQIAEALAYAHGEDVVHGDVKPDNILLAADGRPRLFDFGVARFMTETDPAPIRPATPLYAAPEVRDGRPPTSLSDIYSLGLVLEEMLTGDLPRGEPGADAGPAPPETRLDAAPKTLRLIVARATDPEPLQRYRSVSDLLMDLRAYQRGEPASVDGTAPSRWSWALPWCSCSPSHGTGSFSAINRSPCSPAPRRRSVPLRSSFRRHCWRPWRR
jgi:serine/threonine-protein kinase